ncbi:MAG: hypothetical protein CL840_16905 [Crocinitomicaceae bacterium]|nr:hypothetical protein [Crocinitomicaceae bacterium]|tara:strand:+ start:4271 stop:4849 length:579 start_codon:yes stop_codon:yes gene_type:complete
MPRSKEQFEKIRIRTRNKILAKSLDLFATKGYDSTSASAIAGACGLSKSSLYHHFESKERILITILENSYYDWKEKYGVADQFDEPRQELKRSVLASVQSIKENPKFYKILSELQEKLPDTEEMQKLIAKISSEKMADYASLFKKMGFKDPLDEVYFFGATLSGAIRAYLIIGENYPIDEIVNRLLKNYEIF